MAGLLGAGMPNAGLLSPATVNPLMARKAAAQRGLLTQPTSVMDPRYAAWKQSQDQADTFLMGADLLGAAVPFAGPAAKLGLAGAKSLAPQAANMAEGYMARTGLLQPITVFHGAKNIGALDGLVGKPGGLKMMDGLGPHVGTAEAANHRLAANAGVRPSKAWKKPNEALDGSYVMPFNLDPAKPFVKRDGSHYTEAELQSRLANIAESLGFSRNDTRAFSSAYPASYKMKQAQQAVKDHLSSQGYDAIPYVNSHEARGSTSWVVLDPSNLKPLWKKD